MCYNPDVNTLLNICNILLSNFVKVILVDNTENNCNINLLNIKGVKLIYLNINIGISKAQNIGIKIALQEGAEVIVFFDQDSEIENDFLVNLFSPLKPDQPMVVSPFFIDKKTGFQFPCMKLNTLGLLKTIKNQNFERPFIVDVVISSGSAATKKTFEIAGLMNEDYFIDFVDTEWCLRCKSKGIPIYVVPTAKMLHSIGDKSIDLFFLKLFIHSPVRSYYKVRNSFLFIRNNNVPLLMGVKEIISALIHNSLIILFVKDKKTYFKNYIIAIRDGLLGRTGKRIDK